MQLSGKLFGDYRRYLVRQQFAGLIATGRQTDEPGVDFTGQLEHKAGKPVRVTRGDPLKIRLDSCHIGTENRRHDHGFIAAEQPSPVAVDVILEIIVSNTRRNLGAHREQVFERQLVNAKVTRKQRRRLPGFLSAAIGNRHAFPFHHPDYLFARITRSGIIREPDSLRGNRKGKRYCCGYWSYAPCNSTGS